MAKLIIIRGPSGAGKSTIVDALMKQTKRMTAHIDQDAYRFIFSNMEKSSHMRRKMIKSNILIALEQDCDVIVDGILSPQGYSEILIPETNNLEESIALIRETAGI